MKFEQLHEEVKVRLRAINPEVKNHQIIILSQKDYDMLFWDLLKIQQQRKFKNNEIDLLFQLNGYIDANRQLYAQDFRIKNPTKVTRPSPPVKESDIPSVKKIEALDRHLFKSLQNQALSNDILFGRLLYCAVRFGGLANKHFLTSFSMRLNNQELKSAEELVWFELTGAANELHNWVPDNLSLLLIKQWFDRKVSFPILKSPEHYILKFWRQDTDYSKATLNLTWLFQAVKARLSLSITPFALDILTYKQSNLPLKTLPHLRLLTQKVPPLPFELDDVTKPHYVTAIQAPPAKTTTLANHGESENVLNWTKVRLLELKVSGKRDSVKIDPKKARGTARLLEEKLNINSHKITPITRVLVEWIIHSLIKGGVWSGKLKPSTLIKYLALIKTPLQHSLGYQDPIALDPEELADIYFNIIHLGKNIAARTQRARILRDFHAILELNYKVEPCYIFQEFIAKGNKDKVNLVDANILMPWEYETATAFLMQNNELTGLSEMQKKAVHVALILGFRCGFRRSEVHYLRLEDLEWELSANAIPEWATILISYSESRDLKSISAFRRVPVGHFLNQSELAVLADYCKSRLAMGVADSDLLFYFGEKQPLLGRSAQVVDPNTLFNPLTKLLQRVTGDNSFRYHHLRHSFATWLFWYWTADIHKFSHPIDSLKKHPIFAHLLDARTALLHKSIEHPSRKILHAISSFIGHSGPTITLFHYIHSATWLIWSDLQKQLPKSTNEFNNAIRAQLVKVAEKTIYRKNKECLKTSDYFDGFERSIHRKLAENASLCSTATWDYLDFKKIASLSTTVPFRVNELNVYSGLLAHINSNFSRQWCLEKLELDAQIFDNAIENTKYFFSQQQSRYEYGNRMNSLKNHKKRAYINSEKIITVAESKLPKLPFKAPALAVTIGILTRFQHLNVDEKALVIKAAKFMVDFCSIEWSDIRFRLTKKQSPNGKEWLKLWLQAITLLDKDNDLYKYVRLTLVCRHPLGSTEREKWWSTWTEGLAIPNRAERYNEKFPVTAAAYLDIMDFKEYESAIDDKRAKRNASAKDYRVPSLEGFRLAFYIIFLIHNGRPEFLARHSS